MKKLQAIIALMRPKHWIKNLLVLFPLIFGGQLGNPHLLPASLLGFAACSLAASGVYAANDLADIERDRANPRKAGRPLASGALSPRCGAIAAAILFAVAALLDLAAARVGLGMDAAAPTLGCLVLYVAVNLLYSRGLKTVPVVDVAILASGYFLRVLYGSALTGISISTWLYLTVLSLSFYLGLGKRQGEHEAAGEGGAVREVVSKYPPTFLATNMTVFFTLGLVFYSLWATDPVISAHTAGRMAWTIPLVVLICLRYSFLLEREQHGDPIEVVFSDRPLLCLMVLFAVGVVAIVYAGALGSGAAL